MTEPDWVRSFLVPTRAVAMPKSATFTCPLGATSTFPGFTSRCTRPLRWAKARAAAMSAAMSAARSGWMPPSVLSISARLRPSTYSITMK